MLLSTQGINTDGGHLTAWIESSKYDCGDWLSSNINKQQKRNRLHFRDPRNPLKMFSSIEFIQTK